MNHFSKYVFEVMVSFPCHFSRIDQVILNDGNKIGVG